MKSRLADITSDEPVKQLVMNDSHEDLHLLIVSSTKSILWAASCQGKNHVNHFEEQVSLPCLSDGLWVSDELSSPFHEIQLSLLVVGLERIGRHSWKDPSEISPSNYSLSGPVEATIAKDQRNSRQPVVIQSALQVSPRKNRHLLSVSSSSNAPFALRSTAFKTGLSNGLWILEDPTLPHPQARAGAGASAPRTDIDITLAS